MPSRKQYKISANQAAIYDVIVAELQQNPELADYDMTEGRGTGIPIIRREMEKNGSPEPRVEMDENHSCFIITLPIHPEFLWEEQMSEGVNEGVKLSEVQHNDVLMLIRKGVMKV